MIASEPRVGDVLDARYRILGLLGKGGMGSVYRAEHVGIRRPVAIKLLHPDFADDPEFSKRFEREAFVTGRTSHPNCVTVSDFGRLDDGSYYLVMELVDGALLADVIDEADRLPVRRALHIARHLLRGLGHAHDAGIVHRDVKPTNVILVEQDGDADFAKLLDFGIAKVIGAATGDAPNHQLTRVGTTVGTPTYVAPEQAVGGPVDGRSDLYSLSVLLYEMITGRRPFEHDDVIKLLAMHLSAPVPPMLAIAPDLSVSREVEEVVRRGLAKDRSERWASAADYLAAIDDLLARDALTGAPPVGTPTPWPATPTATPIASPATPAPLGGPAPRRRRLAIGAAVGLGVVLAIVALTREGAPARTPAAGADQASKAGSGKARGGWPGRPGPDPRTDPDQLATQADVLLANGRADEVIALLARRSEVAGHAGAQLRLGHAYAATDRGEQAVTTYGLAIGLDSELRADAVMRANLTAMAGRKNPDAALGALALLARRLDDDAARARLLETAGKDKRNAWRVGARAIAEEAGWLGQVDQLGSYLLDLAHGKNCDERRRAVPRLVALGDARAVPALKKARGRKSGGILGIGAENVNGCMRKELDAAIATLSKPR